MTRRQAFDLLCEIDRLILMHKGDVLLIERAIGAYLRCRLMLLRKKV